MSPRQPETDAVEQVVRIAARPETVWRFWTDPERMCVWWGASADLDPRPGGACEVRMEQGWVMRGEYVELVPFERIVFTFGWEGEGIPPVPPGSSVVEVTLAPDGPDTILTVRHSGLPVGTGAAHDSGWAHFLPVLIDVAKREP